MRYSRSVESSKAKSAGKCQSWILLHHTPDHTGRVKNIFQKVFSITNNKVENNVLNTVLPCLQCLYLLRLVWGSPCQKRHCLLMISRWPGCGRSRRCRRRWRGRARRSRACSRWWRTPAPWSACCTPRWPSWSGWSPWSGWSRRDWHSGASIASCSQSPENNVENKYNK